MFKKGDILEADKRKFHQGRHMILIWGEYRNEYDFEGLMLTHSDRYPDNVLLDKTHVSNDHEFRWENTHFVNQLFIKLSDWGPFEKVGEITESGMSFIEEKLTNTEATYYMDYIKHYVK
ncbi:hypothetical protein [Ekhidna sp.]